jgi:CubicO group peptidase (beta-lactamase class C family)
MKNRKKDNTRETQVRIFLITGMVLILFTVTGCGPSPADLAAVDYTPLPGDNWEVSTPEAEGLDPLLVAELYYEAAQLDRIYSLLVVKNGKLIAEKYFHEGSIDQQNNAQSVTKSYFSALVGIALDQGCLSSVDQTLLEFFPEYADQIDDPRKEEITIRHLLQMRSGYPLEESHPDLADRFFGGEGNWLPLIVDFPLTSDPGTKFQYSNFSSYLLGAIVSRACAVDLKEFAEAYLFDPTNTELGEMWQDDFGFYYPNLHATARDQARFGQLYLDDGVYNGEQIIPARFVHDSLQNYTQDPPAAINRRNYERSAYGYQWWEVQTGDRTYESAQGHGGQVIALVDEHDMVVVLTADPFWLQWGDEHWENEKANNYLVADFIASLPSE